MKRKILSLSLALVSASVILPAYAGHEARFEAKQMINLKDGGVLYVFADGKMAKENKWGHAESLAKVSTVETADGKTMTVTSNEVMRLSTLLERGHRGD
jgi:hypothetical protein